MHLQPDYLIRAKFANMLPTLICSHLQLPLVSSERSWAFAMECKAELDGPKTGLMRQAMLRRLAKAASHAADFSRFAAAKGTARWGLITVLMRNY